MAISIAQSLLLGLQLIDGVHVLCILHSISCRILSSAATDRVLVNGVTVNHYNTRFFLFQVYLHRVLVLHYATPHYLERSRPHSRRLKFV